MFPYLLLLQPASFLLRYRRSHAVEVGASLADVQLQRFTPGQPFDVYAAVVRLE
jgi:hypothetical protein